MIKRSDVADFSYFLVIAKHSSFRRAAVELGITSSALSHAIKSLETRLGVRLLNRTNRSVTLTAAGAELYAEITAPFEAIHSAMDGLNRYRDEPAGLISLNVPNDAATLLLEPVLPQFAMQYPDVHIDLCISNRMVDIIEDGFDAGIRYGGTVPEDMVAQSLSPDFRWVVAGSPAYFALYGYPKHPDDLLKHHCLKFRLGDKSLYRWEFEQDAKKLQMAVPGSFTLDDGRTILSLMLQGVGLMYGPEPLLQPLIDTGQVRIVLEDWAPTAPGFQIYYSSRRQLPTGLKLLIKLIQELRPLG